MVSINVLTNDKHLWLLQGFAYLFNIYWPNQSVNVYGFNHPEFDLPDNFRFHSLSNYNYPAKEWSNALIEMCHMIEEDYFIFMLEDYWLIEYVDQDSIDGMIRYIQGNEDILRVDLSGNRAAYPQAIDYAYGVVRTPSGTPYQMSVQAAVWNRKLLLNVLAPHQSPWQVEIEGSKFLDAYPDILILGAKERLLKYKPVYRSRTGQLSLDKMPKKLVNELKLKGYLI